MTGRRGLAVCLATVLALAMMVPAVLAAGVTSANDYFDGPIYSGGSGWTSDWTEFNDDNEVYTGIVRAVTGSDCVGTSCIQFNIGLLSLDEYAIWRRTDISGATGATLTFSYKRSGVGVMQVWTRSGPSDEWAKTTLNGGLSGYSTASVNLAGDASATTAIRFNISSLLLGASAYIDNVLITASYPTTTTSTTTTTTSTTTTTTTEPIITVPTIPPLLPTTTTTTSAVSSSTTTTDAATTTTTPTSPGSGGGGSGGGGSGGGGTGPEASGSDPSSGDGDQATVNPPLTEEQLDFAAESNIVVNLAGEGDFGGFEPGVGINPMTDLWVNLNATVEVISTEILSALALGAMIAFFGVRRVTDDDAVPQT
ncbi:MAG: hypothetical protein WD274_00795 [Acidimicrobiia bacterium]